MQVNPNPPAGGQTRTSALSGHSQDSKSDHASGAPPVRYDGTIDGVLLNGQQEQEYSAIQQQLQQQTAYAVPSLQQRTTARPDSDGNRNVYSATGSSATKPLVGSEEWYKVRKDNHKEVERRRRETINRGIDELAKVVPDCDKHKGQILQRALEYIKKLKETEQQLLEKLTLEKLMAEQVISDLSNSNKNLKNELSNSWKEVEHWKRQATSRQPASRQ